MPDVGFIGTSAFSSKASWFSGWPAELPFAEVVRLVTDMHTGWPKLLTDRFPIQMDSPVHVATHHLALRTDAAKDRFAFTNNKFVEWDAYLCIRD